MTFTIPNIIPPSLPAMSTLPSTSLGGWPGNNTTPITTGLPTFPAVTDATGMFSNMPGLTTIPPVGTMFPNLTTAKDMFKDSTNITAVDLSGLPSTLTDMSGMLSGLTSLTTVTGLNTADTSNVTDMSGLFSGASSLTTLDMGNLTTSSVTSVTEMFKDTPSLTTINNFDDQNFDSVPEAGFANMFESSNALNTSLNIGNWSTANVQNTTGPADIGGPGVSTPDSWSTTLEWEGGGTIIPPTLGYSADDDWIQLTDLVHPDYNGRYVDWRREEFVRDTYNNLPYMRGDPAPYYTVEATHGGTTYTFLGAAFDGYRPYIQQGPDNGIRFSAFPRDGIHKIRPVSMITTQNDSWPYVDRKVCLGPKPTWWDDHADEAGSKDDYIFLNQTLPTRDQLHAFLPTGEDTQIQIKIIMNDARTDETGNQPIDVATGNIKAKEFLRSMNMFTVEAGHDYIQNNSGTSNDESLHGSINAYINTHHFADTGANRLDAYTSTAQTNRLFPDGTQYISKANTPALTVDTLQDYRNLNYNTNLASTTGAEYVGYNMLQFLLEAIGRDFLVGDYGDHGMYYQHETVGEYLTSCFCPEVSIDGVGIDALVTKIGHLHIGIISSMNSTFNGGYYNLSSQFESNMRSGVKPLSDADAGVLLREVPTAAGDFIEHTVNRSNLYESLPGHTIRWTTQLEDRKMVDRRDLEKSSAPYVEFEFLDNDERKIALPSLGGGDIYDFDPDGTYGLPNTERYFIQTAGAQHVPSGIKPMKVYQYKHDHIVAGTTDYTDKLSNNISKTRFGDGTEFDHIPDHQSYGIRNAWKYSLKWPDTQPLVDHHNSSHTSDMYFHPDLSPDNQDVKGVYANAQGYRNDGIGTKMFNSGHVTDAEQAAAVHKGVGQYGPTENDGSPKMTYRANLTSDVVHLRKHVQIRFVPIVTGEHDDSARTVSYHTTGVDPSDTHVSCSFGEAELDGNSNNDNHIIRVGDTVTLKMADTDLISHTNRVYYKNGSRMSPSEIATALAPGGEGIESFSEEGAYGFKADYENCYELVGGEYKPYTYNGPGPLVAGDFDKYVVIAPDGTRHESFDEHNFAYMLFNNTNDPDDPRNGLYTQSHAVFSPRSTIHPTNGRPVQFDQSGVWSFKFHSAATNTDIDIHTMYVGPELEGSTIPMTEVNSLLAQADFPIEEVPGSADRMESYVRANGFNDAYMAGVFDMGSFHVYGSNNTPYGLSPASSIGLNTQNTSIGANDINPSNTGATLPIAGRYGTNPFSGYEGGSLLFQYPVNAVGKKKVRVYSATMSNGSLFDRTRLTVGNTYYESSNYGIRWTIEQNGTWVVHPRTGPSVNVPAKLVPQLAWTAMMNPATTPEWQQLAVLGDMHHYFYSAIDKIDVSNWHQCKEFHSYYETNYGGYYPANADSVDETPRNVKIETHVMTDDDDARIAQPYKWTTYARSLTTNGQAMYYAQTYPWMVINS